MPISVKISSDLGHFKQCETCVTCGDVWNQRQLCLRTWISAKADNADTQPEYQHSHDHHQHQQAKLLITEKVMIAMNIVVIIMIMMMMAMVILMSVLMIMMMIIGMMRAKKKMITIEIPFAYFHLSILHRSPIFQCHA